MKYLVTVTLILFTGIFAHSGQSTGNGGDVLVCKDSISKTSTYEVLDLYESREDHWGLTLNLGAGSVEQRVQVAIDRLEQKDQIRAERYKTYLSSFFREAQIKDVKLIDISDSQHLFIPENCEVQQAAIQREPQFEGQFRYLISKSIWDQLDDDNKATLILHEIVYRDAIAFGHNNSRVARYMTAWLASDEFENVAEDEFKEFLEKNQLLPNIDYPNVRINQREPIKRYANGQVKFAIVSSEAESYFYFQKKKVIVFPGTGISFHENGHIDCVMIEKSVDLHLAGYQMPLINEICFSQAGRLLSGGLKRPVVIDVDQKQLLIDSYVSIYLTGQWKSFGLSGEQQLNVQNKLVSLKGATELFQNGMVKSSILGEDTEFKIQQKMVLFKKESPIEFHPQGYLREGTLLAETDFEVQGQKLRALKGTNVEFYLDGSISKISTLSSFVGKFVSQNVVSKIQAPSGGRHIVIYPLLLNTGGEVISGYIQKPQALRVTQNVDAKLVGQLRFNEKGLIEGALAENIQLIHRGQELYLRGTTYGAKLEFYESGSLKYAFLAKETLFQVRGQQVWLRGNVLASKLSYPIAFHENGNLNHGSLLYDTKVFVQSRWIEYSRWASISFWSNGEIRSGSTVNDEYLENTYGFVSLVKKECVYDYNQQGKVDIVLPSCLGN